MAGEKSPSSSDSRKSSRNKDGSSKNDDDGSGKKASGGSSLLTKYFFIILLAFATMSMTMNGHFARSVHLREDASAVGSSLKEFRSNSINRLSEREINDKIDALGKGSGGAQDDNGDASNVVGGRNKKGPTERGNFDLDATSTLKDTKGEGGGGKQRHKQPKHKIANLDCEAYGGPSKEAAEEMVYWEDIPSDALNISPFHLDHPDNKIGRQGTTDKDGNNELKHQITQFITFEPDAGA